MICLIHSDSVDLHWVGLLGSLMTQLQQRFAFGNTYEMFEQPPPTSHDFYYNVNTGEVKGILQHSLARYGTPLSGRRHQVI